MQNLIAGMVILSKYCKKDPSWLSGAGSLTFEVRPEDVSPADRLVLVELGFCAPAGCKWLYSIGDFEP